MKPSYVAIVLLSILLLAPLAYAVTYDIIDLAPEKAEYGQGETVTITGKLLVDTTPKADVYVGIEVRSPTDKLVWLDAAKTDAEGTFSSSFKLAPDAELGSYTVYATYVGVKKSTTFEVIIPDVTPPTITHTPVEAAEVGKPITISAIVTDNVEVQVVHLNYRVVGAVEFTQVAMTAVDDVYSATIPAESVTLLGIEYYIQAVDTAGNEARSPEVGYYTIEVWKTTLILAEDMAAPDTSVDFSGTNFAANESYSLTLDWSGITVTLAEGIVGEDGSISGSFVVPAIESGVYTIVAKDGTGRMATAIFGVKQISTAAISKSVADLAVQLLNVQAALSTKIEATESALAESISSAQKAIVAAVSKSEATISGMLADATKSILNAVGKADASISGKIADSTNTIVGEVKVVGTSVVDAVKAAQSDVKGAVSSARAELSTGIKGVSDDLSALSEEVKLISAGVAQAATFALVVTILAIIVIVLEVIVLIRRR